MDSQIIDPNSDVVRRNIKRELPCRLSEEEFTRIARQRATKEAERDELEADLAKEKKRRQDQIDELDDEISKMGRELRTGEQDRTVPCNEVFHRASDGTGWIHTIRLDTLDEVERRPATAHETQRYLPGTDGPSGGLLEDAQRAQRSAQDDVPAGTPEHDEEDGDDQGDEATDGADKKRGGKAKRR